MSLTRTNFSSIYNPANLTKDELISNFAIREKEFTEIMRVIKTDKMETPPQHFIIEGLRGSGKTTLLLRLFYAVGDDGELNKFLLPVIFDEEQYGIRSLSRLWEEIASYLEDKYNHLFCGIVSSMEKYFNEEDCEELCFHVLEETLIAKGQKLVLFIDNFGEMLGKFSIKEQQRLREVLIQCKDIRIVGASALVLEFHYDYSKPFFEFFKVFHLEGLTSKEMVKFLLRLSETYKVENAGKIALENPGRIEALRLVSDGVPRTVILLFEIFARNGDGDAFHDLEIILDQVTPFYKHRMDELPAQKQEIIDTIALNWDALGVGEISQKTRIQGKIVSAQLNELEKNRIITKIPTSTKNNLYRVSERFFNIWYLMRYGKKREKTRVLWLVKFLESWYNKQQLIDIARRHMAAIKAGDITEKKAYFLTEALAKVGILPWSVEEEMINTVREFLSGIGSALSQELSKSDNSLMVEAQKFIESKEYSQAVRKLSAIKNKDGNVYYLLGNMYAELNETQEVERYLLEAAKMNHVYAMTSLANLYFKDVTKRQEAFNLAKTAFELEENHYTTLGYARFLMADEGLDEIFPVIKLCLEKYLECYPDDFLTSLLDYLFARKQYHYLVQLFKENKFDIKDRFKPVYYALMILHKDEYPDEYKKMGPELEQTVEEIVKKVDYLAEAYEDNDKAAHEMIMAINRQPYYSMLVDTPGK